MSEEVGMMDTTKEQQKEGLKGDRDGSVVRKYGHRAGDVILLKKIEPT